MGDHDLRTELFRLCDGAICQFLAGESSGKAKIVFNLRARTRLPTRRALFDDQHIEPFRSTVHRCGQPRRPGADDDKVSDLRIVDVTIESQALGELVQRRLSENLGVVADHHGNVRDTDSEAIKQFLRRRV